MMGKPKLFARLLLRPLAKEPVRTALTVFSVALGVAVVLAMDLAGNAATGSFRSSLETLSGKSDFEITAIGGVPEEIVGKLNSLPYAIRVKPRMEDFAVITSTKRTVPLIGLDLIGEANDAEKETTLNELSKLSEVEDGWKYLGAADSVWTGESLGLKAGDRVNLLIQDREGEYAVRGVFPDAGGNEAAIVMDIAAAQRALGRAGKVDRIAIQVPQGDSGANWENLLRAALPDSVQLSAAGATTAENQKMLAAFRWNLKLLSYIALIVGAFLIYNTISVSVVRRRAEIGIVRALGATRRQVLGAFIGEAASIGLAGSLLGLPLGRLMATGAVKLMGTTVNALYVSSRPGEISLSAGTIVPAIVAGIFVAVISAYSPAREAALIAPVDAMARGRREFAVRVDKKRDFWIALALGAVAGMASRVPAVFGKPVFAYAAVLLLIAAGVFAIPAVADFVLQASARLLKPMGAEGLLASRSLRGSLRRTSALTAALCTAVAMMTSVGIMVGSFRQTVVNWMETQLPADLYLRPAGAPAADRHPVISLELAKTLASLPGVDAVERLRAYEIRYDGMPATLASVDLHTQGPHRGSEFLSGEPTTAVFAELRGRNAVVVSEPFSYKHKVKRGDSIALSLGERTTRFQIADVFYDYGSERGVIVMDRETLLKYLPDPAPTNMAIYVKPEANAGEVRKEIEEAAAEYRILIFSNRDLRAQAIQIFDKTFAITYALEAVAVLVAVMGVAGALLALVIDRRRELGLLRFLGADSGQLRKLILTEAGLLGLLANLAGIVLGFLLSLILIFVINKQSFGWTIQFHLPVAVIAGAMLLVFAATVLAGFYPARVAVRLNALEVVHEE